MKKLICMLCVLLMISPACAEAPSVSVAIEAVGSQYSTEGEKCTLDRITVTDSATGKVVQELYAFVSYLPNENGLLKLDDVNFDGHPDLTLLTIMGASNECRQFFLWDEARGQFSTNSTPAVWNYSLLPEKELVLSRANNGWAGLLHESRVYRWEMGELILLRSVVWDTYIENTFAGEGGTWTSTQFGDNSRVVETYTVYGDNYQQQTYTFNADAYQEQDFFNARSAVENEFLRLE